MTNRAAWQSSLWGGMEDDDDQDSDTDSRLSGSVAVDSVLRRLHQNKHYTRADFTLDPIADQSLHEETTAITAYPAAGRMTNGNYPPYHRTTVPLTNGYHGSPSHSRRPMAYGGSPKLQQHLMPTMVGGGGARRDLQPTSYQHVGRRKDILSPVPETSLSGGPDGRGGWIPARPSSRSSGVHQGSPVFAHRGLMQSGALVSSMDGLPRSQSEHANMLISGSGNRPIRRSSIGPSPGPSPYRQMMMGSPQHESYLPTLHDNQLEHQVSSMGHRTGHMHSTAAPQEPNLNDVVDFLSNPDPTLIANAASYLQHLAYNDDQMKAKIRQYGAIPSLVNQLRHPDFRVQLAVLGALRNMSYGRTNNDSKVEIADDPGLGELTILLKITSHAEVRELVTQILWNLSSCDDLKLRILQVCLKDLVDYILLPHTRYDISHPATRSFSIRPDQMSWTPELRNTLGALRNISSAGEGARKYLRSSYRVVDTLVWTVRAATTQENVNDKAVENAVCILRNLSYRLENEVDPQEGADDDKDCEWEKELQREIEETQQQEAAPRRSRGTFLMLCFAPNTDDGPRRNLPRLSPPLNLPQPDSSLAPIHHRPVMGVALLWQPEIVIPYLAVMEKYTANNDLVEAATGAIQNLTACSWKWSVYMRAVVRKAKGLTLLIDLINHPHDTVVRAAATALRNLAVDAMNKKIIGAHCTQSIITRLPYGQNNLGISESTAVALLCTLMELCMGSLDNCRFLRESGGVRAVVKLTQSKEHTPKTIFAAHKLCAILCENKSLKSVVKQAGWNPRAYRRMIMETAQQFEFERISRPLSEQPASGGAHRRSTRKEKERKKSAPQPPQQPIQPSLPLSQESHQSQPLPAPPGIQDIPEAGYQMIGVTSKQQTPVSPPITPHSIPQIFPGGTYAEINDPQLESIRQQAQINQSEMRSTPSELLGNVTPHDQLVSEDEMDTDLATYAQVDMHKKRESRRKKREQTRTTPTPEHHRDAMSPKNPPVDQGMDSWV